MIFKTLLANQMRYMQSHGMDVILMSADGPAREDVIRQEGCRYIVVPMTRKITPLSDLRSLFGLIRQLRDLKPDIVHTQSPKANLIGTFAAWFCKVPVRILSNAGHPLSIETGFKYRMLAKVFRLAYRAATHVWVNSESLYQMALDKKLVGENKLELVAGKGSTNGIDLKRYSSGSLEADTLNAIKIKIKYETNLTYLVAVARLVKYKGIEELVSAFVRLQRDFPDIRLLLVGRFEDDIDAISAETHRMITSHDAIIHIGWSDRVEYYLELSDYFVHPSHREGFPQAIMQAGAMQCPVICSDAPGNIDLIRNEETGLLFQSQNAESLELTLRMVLEGKRDMRLYANNLFAVLTEHYPQPVIHKKIFDRYQALLNTASQKIPMSS